MKKLIVVMAILSLVVGWLVPVVAQADPTADITITATPTYVALTVSDGGTNTWAIGTVTTSATKWYTADGNAPSPEPFQDSDMKIVITNTGSVSEDIDIHGHAFTGGVGWALSTDDTPGSDEVSIRAGITGTTDEAGMVQVISTDTELKAALAAAGHIDSCLELETGTAFTDGEAKSGTVTYTASVAS